MPDETTVTVGDTEVIVWETDDGFEVEEATDAPDGPFIVAGDGKGYGAIIPADSPFVVESSGGSSVTFFHRGEDDLSGMKSWVARAPIATDRCDEVPPDGCDEVDRGFHFSLRESKESFFRWVSTLDEARSVAGD